MGVRLLGGSHSALFQNQCQIWNRSTQHSRLNLVELEAFRCAHGMMCCYLGVDGMTGDAVSVHVVGVAVDVMIVGDAVVVGNAFVVVHDWRDDGDSDG